MNMIRGSAEYEAHTQQVLEQHEAEAVAKFTALIPTFTDNIPAALDALADLQAVRGLTKLEKSIMSDLIQLDMYMNVISCFTPKAHALKKDALKV
jgi:hypothetical protein